MFAPCHRYFGNEEFQLDHRQRDMDQELVLELPELVLVLPELGQELLELGHELLEGSAQELDSVPGLD